MYEHGEREMSDEEFMENAIIGSDPDQHVERIRELEKLGATVIVLQNNSGADPIGAIETYGKHVLPALRGVRPSWGGPAGAERRRRAPADPSSSRRVSREGAILSSACKRVS